MAETAGHVDVSAGSQQLRTPLLQHLLPHSSGATCALPRPVCSGAATIRPVCYNYSTRRQLLRLTLPMLLERPLPQLSIFHPFALQAVHQLLRAAPNTADARTNKGLNALHLACSTDRPRVLEALLDLAPQLASSVTTEEQQNAMHVAALDGGGACLELLCHVAPQLATQVDAWGATPLVLASGAGSADMAALLLDAAPIAVDMGDNMG